MMVDGGLPTRYFEDIIDSGAEYLDFVKFGWGTAIVTKDLCRKIEILSGAGVDYYFGGTLFEKYVLQDRLDEFRDLCHQYSCQFVEVSNGTIDLSNSEKAGYIRKLSDDFRVVGSDVNLGNVAATAILGLETIRLGLRSDTLTCFDSGAA